jgi:hypothetical protein
VQIRYLYLVIPAILLLALIRVAAAPGDAAPSVALVGEPQPVFEWSRDACEPNDFVDAPARAFRTADGVRLFASHFAARAMSGPDGDHLAHDCTVAFRGAQSGDPAQFSDFAWLMSPYALGDGKVFALVHNEFQGHRYDGLCAADEYHPCWENTVTWAMSVDDGRSFQAPPVERRLIAGLPWRYDRNRDRPGGYFNPSNIVAMDGAWYALAWARPYRDQQGGVCVLRSTRLDDPTAWRAWDGSGYTISFVDPNRRTVDDPDRHVCAPVGVDVFRSAPSSLVRDEASGLFLALQASNMPEPGGGSTPGIWVSASRDLIDWSPLALAWGVPVWGPQNCDARNPTVAWSVAYPSLIDFDSPTPNFETVSGTAWLYFTRYRLEACAIGKDRSLWRVRVQIGESDG